jgi:hypothetical protein
MDFTRISKGTLLLKLQFCGPAPETFWHFTDMPLLCTKHLGQNERNAIGSFAMASGGPAKSGQAGSVLGREKGRGGARAHLRLNCGRGWGGGSSGGVARRRRPRRAAALPAPARRGAMRRNRRLGRLEWGLEEVLERREGGGSGRRWGSSVAAPRVVQRPRLARCAASSHKGSTTTLSREVVSCSGANASSQTRRSTARTLVGAHRDGNRRRTGR